MHSRSPHYGSDGAENISTRDESLRRILLWTVMPTHHQSSFIAALRADGFDVIVHYYDRISNERRQLGWHEYKTLPDGEKYVPAAVDALSLCPDWRQRVHILPGYAKPFLVALAARLSLSGVDWLHWSEPSGINKKSLPGFFVRRIYGALVDRWALGALAIGELARRDFQSWGISPKKIHYLPYSVAPLKDTHAMSPRDSVGVRFLFLGALCHRKGVDVLLKAFAAVLGSYQTARLNLVGNDQANGEYQRLAAVLNVGDAVSFLPAVSADAVAFPIASSDVLVLPSRFDGWGVVINEATSLGKAIIATSACGAAHHLVKDGDNGFVIEAGNVEQLTQRMKDYCGTASLALRHGIVSRKLFADVSPERNAERFRDALRILAAGNSEQRLAIGFDS